MQHIIPVKYESPQYTIELLQVNKKKAAHLKSSKSLNRHVIEEEARWLISVCKDVHPHGGNPHENHNEVTFYTHPVGRH